MRQEDLLENLRKQSENLSKAEDTLLIRIQRIIRTRADIDEQIDRLEKELSK